MTSYMEKVRQSSELSRRGFVKASAAATAALAAARLARLLAAHCRPDPSTPVSRLIAALPEVLPRSRDEILALGRA